MGKRARWSAILFIFGFSLCAAIQSYAGGPPLPEDINIIPPAANLPKDIAAFSGKWAGEWSDKTEMILIVEEIHETWARVIYSWGDGDRSRAGYFRQKCRVTLVPKAKIEVESQNFPNVYFEMNDANSLEGVTEIRRPTMNQLILRVSLRKTN